jgi:hypothetical protein
MGSSISEMSNSKSKTNIKDPNTLSTQSSQNQQTLTSSSSTNTVIKTPQDKCTDISNELNSLEIEINNFVGLRNDRAYLKLEELLTRCLLKLDEIDRGDEKINDMRKNLINFTHKLSDKLELAVSSNLSNETNNDSITQQQTDK